MSGTTKSGAATPAIHVSVEDQELARRMTRAIAAAVGAARDALVAPTSRSTDAAPVVRLRTRKRLALLAPERLAGSIAVVRVTERNARHLVEIVEGTRAARALGVQMVWDGHDPTRRIERHVFAVLERARATPSGPPVLLARSDQPVEALRILIASANANANQKKEERS